MGYESLPLPFAAGDGSPPALEPFDLPASGVAGIAMVAGVVGVPDPRVPGEGGTAGVAGVAPDLAGLSVVAWPFGFVFDCAAGGVVAGLTEWVVGPEEVAGECGAGVGWAVLVLTTRPKNTCRSWWD